jgi:hypothetical protein
MMESSNAILSLSGARRCDAIRQAILQFENALRLVQREAARASLMSVYVYVTRKSDPFETEGPDISAKEWAELVANDPIFRSPIRRTGYRPPRRSTLGINS